MKSQVHNDDNELVFYDVSHLYSGDIVDYLTEIFHYLGFCWDVWTWKRNDTETVNMSWWLATIRYMFFICPAVFFEYTLNEQERVV